MPNAGDERSYLLTLQEVSDLVSHSHDLAETLANTVRHVGGRFAADVCSIYLYDAAREHLVLRATVGLAAEGVNRTRLPRGQGLVGLVAETRQTVNLDDAQTHPRFLLVPELGEEPYHGFLGLPMISGGRLLGVLVLQHRRPVRHTAEQVIVLAGVAAQVASLAANAALNEELARQVRADSSAGAAGDGETYLPPSDDNRPSGERRGTPVCPGLAVGRAVRLSAFDVSDPTRYGRPAGPAEAERALLSDALTKVRGDLDAAARHLDDLLGPSFGAMIAAQRLILEDRSLQTELQRLLDAGRSAEAAVAECCREYLRAFEALDNPYFLERVYDVKDVFRRLLQRLSPQVAWQCDAPAIIVVAAEVSLLELFTHDLAKLRGLVVERGGLFSHVAILARSLHIPMVTQVGRATRWVRDGDEVVVDGGSGAVYCNPDAAQRAVLVRLLSAAPSAAATRRPDNPLPVAVAATVNLLPEVTRAVEVDADGVGLYRSEFLQLARRAFPTEEEQVEAYRAMLSLLASRPLTVRTFDLRAEKLFGEVPAVHDAPAGPTSWEWRRADELPHVQELLRVQLRALFRAAETGPLRILFPMMATQRQFRCALRLVAEARRSLRTEGLSHDPAVPLGVMVELPAAALLIGRWATEIDFVSIGSNDLLHNLFGIGRDDDDLAALKNPLEPGFLRVVAHVVRRATLHHRPVTVCGEAASDPLGARALAMLGVHSLSVPPDAVNTIRHALATPTTDLAPLRRRLLRQEDPADVRRLLDRVFGTLPASPAAASAA